MIASPTNSLIHGPWYLYLQRDAYTKEYDHKQFKLDYTITYRGLFSGNPAVHWATTRQNESLSSPPARPPIAYLATKK
jgi:hypothetical protein